MAEDISVAPVTTTTTTTSTSTTTTEGERGVVSVPVWIELVRKRESIVGQTDLEAAVTRILENVPTQRLLQEYVFVFSPLSRSLSLSLSLFVCECVSE
jgi:hypothetical protein